MESATPMLKQYQQIKKGYQDCILFFRLGDFYEMFFEDAKIASSILDLVLTSRGSDVTNRIPMCGVPFHAAENYIAKLIKAGQKVAICEQVEDPAQAKGIVKRDVIRVITAGTFFDESSDSRYLFSLSLNSKTIGIAFTDVTNGAIQTNQYHNPHQVIEIISKLPAYECIFPEGAKQEVKEFLSHPLLKSKNMTFSSHWLAYKYFFISQHKVHKFSLLLNLPTPIFEQGGYFFLFLFQFQSFSP